MTYKENRKERLDKWLQGKLNITRSQIKKMILNKQILVNNEIPRVHHWLKSDDKIIYNKNEQKKDTAPVSWPKIKIIDQNTEYLIINKPQGLLVHPTEKKENNTLADWLIHEFPQTKKIGDDPQRPAIVHRLDKEVSGLMVIPLTQDSFDNLKKQFQDRTIKKEYTALVHGQLINQQGLIDTPLGRDKKTGLIKTQDQKNTGKKALTIYEVIKKYINYTLVKVQIKTGRMHQIRTHFYSIGHSIVGDKLYQTKDIRKKKKILDMRIFLHANFLQFRDLAGHWQKYNTSLPSDLKKFLNTIK